MFWRTIGQGKKKGRFGMRERMSLIFIWWLEKPSVIDWHLIRGLKARGEGALWEDVEAKGIASAKFLR